MDLVADVCIDIKVLRRKMLREYLQSEQSYIATVFKNSGVFVIQLSQSSSSIVYQMKRPNFVHSYF